MAVPGAVNRRGTGLCNNHGITHPLPTYADLTDSPDSKLAIAVFSGETASHAAVVLANGHRISGFEQTQPLPVYSVGGQVSHIPTTPALSALRQVLCYDGYLAAQPANQQHCIGASYHRGSEETAYREDDQQQNRQRLIDCFPERYVGKRGRR